MVAPRQRRTDWFRIVVLVLGMLLSGRGHVVAHADVDGADDHAQHDAWDEGDGACAFCLLGGLVPTPAPQPSDRAGPERPAGDAPEAAPRRSVERGGTPPRGPPRTR